MQIHWFSIINSCVTVLLLTGFLATILLRVLKNDFLKYTKDDEMGGDQEETGWKYLHGDVFRFPPHVNLFSAMLGVGLQVQGGRAAWRLRPWNTALLVKMHTCAHCELQADCHF